MDGHTGEVESGLEESACGGGGLYRNERGMGESWCVEAQSWLLVIKSNYLNHGFRIRIQYNNPINLDSGLLLYQLPYHGK